MDGGTLGGLLGRGGAADTVAADTFMRLQHLKQGEGMGCRQEEKGQT